MRFGSRMRRARTALVLISALAGSLQSQQGASNPIVQLVGPSDVPLIQALRLGDLDEARKVFHSGAKLNVSDKFGLTPLQTAIMGGETDFAEELLAAGADPKFTGPGRDTSLMAAAFQCDVKIATKLLARGVSANARDILDETALMLASQTCQDGKMVQLLLEAGADPNARCQGGLTSLMWATRNPSAVQELLDAGADPRVKDSRGETVEDKSCDRGEKHFAEVCGLVRQALNKH